MPVIAMGYARAMLDAYIEDAPEDQRAALFMFLAQIRQERLVVGQGGGIERDALHDLVLEVRLALGEPSGNAQDARGTAAKQEEERLVKRIQLDECSVKIHA